MNRIIPKPFAGSSLIILAAFAAGIVAGAGGSVSSVTAGLTAVAGLIALIVFRNRPGAASLFVIVTAAVTGMFAVSVQVADEKSFAPPDEVIDRPVSIAGAIRETPRIVDGTTTFLLSCEGLSFQGMVWPERGTIPCTLLGRELMLSEGDRIAVRGTIRKRLQPLARSSGALIRPPAPYSSPYRFISIESAGEEIFTTGDGTPFERIRRAVSALIDSFPFGGHGDLLKAMTIGDTRRLNPSLRETFSRAGIAHLLAVSGLHAGILALALSVVFGAAGMGRVGRTTGTILFLFLYAGICGFRPPVVRAFVMCSLVLGGMMVGRRVWGEHTLALAVLIILAFDPLALFGPSLQLSFAAVWSIVTFHRPLSAFIQRGLTPGLRTRPAVGYLLSTVTVSSLATVGTAPVAAAHFGLLPLLSIPVNIIAIPLTGAIICAGAITLVLAGFGSLFAPIALFSSVVTGGLLGILELLAGMTADLPFSSIETGAVSPLVALALVSWLFLLSRAKGRLLVRRSLVYLPLFAVLVVTWQPLVSATSGREGGGAVRFLNVGQGDAALIGTPLSGYFLVDTGTASAGRSVVVPSLAALGVHRLDGIFLSHFDDDHVGGLDEILDTVEVDRIFCREEAADSCARALDRPVTGLAAGDSIGFPGGSIIVLSPPSPEVLRHYGITGENNCSLVLGYSMGQSRILFTGDIEPDAQRLLSTWDDRLVSDILKVPHHGAWPLDGDFVASVAPDLAVVSCGLNNRYGHPAGETVALLDSLGVTTLRTDRTGTIEVSSSREGIVTRSLSW